MTPRVATTAGIRRVPVEPELPLEISGPDVAHVVDECPALLRRNGPIQQMRRLLLLRERHRQYACSRSSVPARASSLLGERFDRRGESRMHGVPDVRLVDPCGSTRRSGWPAFIFDGAPGHTPGRFVEVEDETGASVGMDDREWAPLSVRYEPTNQDHPDWGTFGPNLWRLGPFNRPAGAVSMDAERLAAALDEADTDMVGCAEKGGDFIDGAEWALNRVRTAVAPSEPMAHRIAPCRRLGLGPVEAELFHFIPLPAVSLLAAGCGVSNSEIEIPLSSQPFFQSALYSSNVIGHHSSPVSM
jgi:hypothetical protein